MWALEGSGAFKEKRTCPDLRSPDLRSLPEPNGRSYESGKWFWTTTESAQKWVTKNAAMYPTGYRVILGEVPAEVANASQQAANLDQIGDAVFIESDKAANIPTKDLSK